MTFLKNDKRINRNGRPAGSKNKVSYDLRENINDFLNDNFSVIQTEFQKLSSKDKLKFYIDLMQFTLPKLKTIEYSESKERKKVEISMDAETIKRINEELEQKY